MQWLLNLDGCNMVYFVKTNQIHQNPLIEWLYENKIEGYAFYASSWNTGCNWLFEFKKEADAVAFKLRWG